MAGNYSLRLYIKQPQHPCNEDAVAVVFEVMMFSLCQRKYQNLCCENTQEHR